MRLKTEFIQLPVLFDAQRLAQEALQFSEDEWQYHHQGYKGNSALVLVSPNGERNNDHSGEMQATEMLARCPYIQQILASFNTVIGRSRLMRLDPGAQVPAHFDVNASWRKRVRIHIPIVTHPDVTFSSIGNIDVHMQAGEAWIFDNWQTHAVQNNSHVQRIHLVVDTTGSADFWSLADNGLDPRARNEPSNNGWADKLKTWPFQPDQAVTIPCERYNQTTIYSPDELDNMMREFMDDLGALKSSRPDQHHAFCKAVNNFQHNWRSHWLLYGDTLEGLPHYKLLQRDISVESKALLGDTRLSSNAAPASDVFNRWLGATTDAEAIRQRGSAPGGKPAGNARSLDISLFDCPIFIVAAPRSGSTMLFETLQENMELWTLGDESHQVFESIKALHPAAKKFVSNALDASDYSEQIGTTLVASFLRRLQNSRGKLFSQIPPETQSSSLRFLEKTPKNALRIPFLRELFPNAIFIYLYREANQNIGSIIDAWHSGKFVTYPKLPNWSGLPWSLLLPEGWRNFDGRPLAEIAAWQWASTNKKIINDLHSLPDTSWHSVSYDEFLNDKEAALKKICTFADIPFGPRMQALAKQSLPNSKYTLSQPAADKWKRHEADITAACSNIADIDVVTQMIAGLNRKQAEN